MSNLNSVKNSIKAQFDAMLSRGTIPCFEYQISEDDYLLVNLELSDNGLLFSFDSDNKRVAFDGVIEVINNNHYLLPFDEYFDDLDYYLQMIDENMTEGYLLVNDLYYSECEWLWMNRY